MPQVVKLEVFECSFFSQVSPTSFDVVEYIFLKPKKDLIERIKAVEI